MAARAHACLSVGWAMALRTRTAHRAARHTVHTTGPQVTTQGSRSIGGKNSTSCSPSDARATDDQRTWARAQPAKEPPRTSATATPRRLKVSSQVISGVQSEGDSLASSRPRVGGTASRAEAGQLVPALAGCTGENHGHQAQQRESKPKLTRRQLQTNALPLCSKGLHRRTLLYFKCVDSCRNRSHTQMIGAR